MSYEFEAAVVGLKHGDFSWSEPLFVPNLDASDPRPLIIRWYEQGLFDEEPQALAEALSSACFLGRVDVAEYLLKHGVDPSAGNGTGLNAFHWAANRGQLEAVRLLIRHHAPLENRNMYGGTILGATVWAAINEPKPDHPQIIEELLAAGADLREAEFPTGHQPIDALLLRYR
jgi:ankyrin repeat protein